MNIKYVDTDFANLDFKTILRIEQLGEVQLTGSFGYSDVDHEMTNEGILISMGLENMLDHKYQIHLGGYNRIKDSDVGLGERSPGTGRNIYLRVQIQR